jgi:4,5-DOPA dioxygenase extradiol
MDKREAGRPLGRREALAGLAGVALAEVAACQRPHPMAAAASGPGPAAGGAPRTKPGGAPQTSGAERMPALFMAHGYPLWSRDEARIADFRGWAANLPRPRSVLMLSAHWESAPATLGATRTVPLVYDFYGFPAELYQNKYPAPGAPELANRVEGLLAQAGLPSQRDEERGLDHGAYVPLQMMYPAADVPILQVSLPTLEPGPLLALGRALRPLRDEGVLIVGSGFLTHNLRRFDPRPGAPLQPWAQEFDAWSAEVIERRDVDRLLQYRSLAPAVAQALPTHEHFVPVVVALGASVDAAEPVSFPITGWEAGSLTRRCVQFG